MCSHGSYVCWLGPSISDTELFTVTLKRTCHINLVPFFMNTQNCAWWYGVLHFVLLTHHVDHESHLFNVHYYPIHQLIKENLCINNVLRPSVSINIFINTPLCMSIKGIASRFMDESFLNVDQRGERLYDLWSNERTHWSICNLVFWYFMSISIICQTLL